MTMRTNAPTKQLKALKNDNILIDIINCLLIAASAYIITGGIFSRGILITADHPMHFMEVFYLVKKLMPLYHWVDGWCMEPPPGHPMLLYVYQLGGWLVALVNMAFKIDLNLSYKILMYVSAAFPPIALYFFLKKRLGAPAAITGSFLFVFQTLHINLLLTSVWNSYLVIGIFIIFFDILDRNYKNLTLRTIAILSILQALIIVGHPIAHLVSFMLVGAFFIFSLFKHMKDGTGLRIKPFLLLLVPVGGSLVTFYYLYNLLMSRDWLVGFNGPWLDGTFIANMSLLLKTVFGGFDNFIDPKLLAASRYTAFFRDALVTFFTSIPELARSCLGLAGLGLFFFRKEREGSDFFRITLIFSLFTFFVFTGVWHYMPVIKDMPLVGTMINKRLLIYLHLIMCIFAAYAIKYILGYFKHSLFAKNRLLLYSIGAALVLAISVSERHIVYLSGLTATTENVKKVEDIKKVWEWSRANADRNSRIVYQSTFGNDAGESVLSRSHIMALGLYYTPCLIVTTCGTTEQFPTYKTLDTSNGKFFGVPVEIVSREDIVEKMEAFNIKYAVSLEPRLEKKLESIHDFRKIKSIGDFTIFEYPGLKTRWAYLAEGESSGACIVEEFGDYRIVISGHNNIIDNELVVKVGYHPYWNATLNRKKANLTSGKFGLMSVRLPEAGAFRLELIYNSKKTIPILISIASLIILLALSLARGHPRNG